MVGMRLSTAVLLFGILLVGAAVLGGTVSYGLFVDSQDGSGMIEAADQFNKVRFPDEDVAYDDANQNGIWDSYESTYDVQTLGSFSDSSIHLRFHNRTNKITSQTLDVESRTVSRDKKFNIDLKHDGHSVRLHATDDIDISDMTMKNGDQIEIASVDGNVDISGSFFQDNNNVTVLAENGSIITDGNTRCNQNNNVTIRDSDGSITCK